MGRGVKLGLGVLLLIIGVLITLVGVGLMVVVGPDGSASTPSTDIHTDGSALVFDALTVRDRLRQDGSLAITLGLDVTSSQGPVFVGVGPALDVEGYLRGVPIDLVRELRWSDDALVTIPISGSRTPEPPADQSFWDASDVGGGTRSIDWTVATGDWRVVIMNADGSQGLDVRGLARIRWAPLGWISVAVLVFGAMMLIGGFILTVAGTRSPKKATIGGLAEPASGPTGTPATSPPPIPAPPPSRPDAPG